MLARLGCVQPHARLGSPTSWATTEQVEYVGCGLSQGVQTTLDRGAKGKGLTSLQVCDLPWPGQAEVTVTSGQLSCPPAFPPCDLSSPSCPWKTWPLSWALHLTTPPGAAPRRGLSTQHLCKNRQLLAHRWWQRRQGHPACSWLRPCSGQAVAWEGESEGRARGGPLWPPGLHPADEPCPQGLAEPWNWMQAPGSHLLPASQ